MSAILWGLRQALKRSGSLRQPRDQPAEDMNRYLEEVDKLGCQLARAQDDSKPDLYDHPLAPEHVLLRAPAVPPHTKA